MTDVELSGLEVKPYIHLQKNCRPSISGYIMEPIDSNLTIDLSHFNKIDKINIITKRISGNGKVRINNINYEVLSKESNRLEFQPSEVKLNFYRNHECIGKIIICSIIISINDIEININPSILEPKKISKNPENWRNILIKCGDVKGIKLFNNKLYAAEGAFIQKGNLIDTLTSDPPNCFVKNDVIKFVYPCEITSVFFNDGFDLPSNSKNKYKHFTDPPPLSSNTMTDINNTNNIITSHQITNSKPNNILYDSSESGFNINTLNNVSEVIPNQGRNNKGIVLKRTGTFSIPMSILQPSMQYIVVVNIQKINGNGKFGVELTTTDGVSKSSTIVLATERETELHLKLNSDSPPNPGSTYLLKIFRPAESTVGDVLLNRLILINGITLANNYTQQTNINSNFHSKSSFVFDKNESDQIRALAKKYSRIISHNKNTSSFNYNGEITIKTKSGMNWFNKISPLCPRLKLVSDAKVLIGELHSLIPADKIWLNAFNDDNISNNDNDILKNAKMILSPSLQNTELLKKMYPNIQIQLLEKTWPIIEETKIKHLPENYIVMFHRNEAITKKIVKMYSNDYPTLLLIGAPETYSGNIIQMNEYISYDKIIYILNNSKGLIDIPKVDDYYSGILSLALGLGVPVLTSNWLGLTENNCKFIIAKDKINQFKVPNSNNLKNGIEDLLKFNKKPSDNNHNEKLNKILQVLFS